MEDEVDAVPDVTAAMDETKTDLIVPDDVELEGQSEEERAKTRRLTAVRERLRLRRQSKNIAPSTEVVPSTSSPEAVPSTPSLSPAPSASSLLPAPSTRPDEEEKGDLTTTATSRIQDDDVNPEGSASVPTPEVVKEEETASSPSPVVDEQDEKKRRMLEMRARIRKRMDAKASENASNANKSSAARAPPASPSAVMVNEEED
eukprot:TRINITY_DN7883_c0_g1_i1.p1 TRINITY_DN7883_c0_g1~~TRINITY_DN7883_c0_g1_i1.p1  ORF type:complete len:203 (+),score=60.83 TRINITY_DN7883_c0_g1_i1:358-966(+)